MARTLFVVFAFVLTVAAAPNVSTARAAPCLVVTLTGTQSGPAVFNGQAGAVYKQYEPLVAQVNRWMTLGAARLSARLF